MRRLAAGFLVLALVPAACSNEERVVVAAGTTLVDSGFLQAVIDQYPGDSTISLVGVSSLEALSLVGGGSADLAITHLPDAEDEFVAGHPGAKQAPAFESFFCLVGPSNPVVGNPDAISNLRSIAERGLPFVGRADGSGTAAKERELWALSGIDPTGQPWYIETGQGMGFTLQVADQRIAFTLSEMGAFLRAEDSLALERIGCSASAESMANPYTLTVAAEASDSAGDLFTWLSGPDAVEPILAVNQSLFGDVIYAPPRP